MDVRPIERTCDDCFHCKACHMWSSGAISKTVAEKCPQFEPVRYATLKELQDLYKMHKGEVVPVRHGEWLPWIEEVEIYNTGGFREPKQVGWLCSKCKGGRCTFQRKYCPDCGAKMDAKEEKP